ncbi:MAG: hypothetical protein C4B59_02935 [Candidatus Methanogaster sp.]|uniref:Uncharacterized protein n=1 Tax=Candidatus Methanogaster sp. TaxID=3386292 RepID=A0AC61L641_9EURY|nr:MAG: hypothetical protein C4B59_02935 [ANME-2 cluster archaeon]
MLISPDSDLEQIIDLNKNSFFIEKNEYSNSISESLIIPNLYSASNNLNLSTTDNVTPSLKYSSIYLTDADIFDADNNFIGHYNTIEISPLSEDSARVYKGSNFSVNGNGSISSYSPATGGLGMSINWTSFNLSTDKLILEINDGSISADGFAYSGHYTLNADSAEIGGNGPMALTFANDVELNITEGSLVIGDESSYSGFTGTINVSEFNQTHDNVNLNGDFDRSLSTHLEPGNSVTDSFTNITLNLIVESNEDDTYELTSTVPEGWGVITNSDGTIKVIPEKGATPGEYRVSVTTVSTTEPELLSTTSAFIEIAESAGVDAGITKEELIYVPLGDNINNGIFSAYQLSITNRGSTDQTFRITTAGIPDEWVLFSRNDVTVPAGKTHLVGLYIKPTTIISQTTTAFTATVTSISDPTITDSVSTDFEMPVYRGVDVSTTPCLLYAVANGSASFDLNVTSQSNVGDIYNITVELPDGWTADYVNNTLLDTGESFRQQVSITTDNTSTGEVYFVGVSAGSIYKENASDYKVLSLIVAESVDDTEPPVITSVHATGITNNSAVITWDTDEMSDSLVKYGTESGNYPITTYNEINVTFHSINLAGLSPGTTYYYAVNSTDQSNNPAQSTEYNFTTLALPDSEPPGITNVMNTTPTGTSVTITWDTDEASDSLVRYGTEPGNYTLSASNESFVLEHSINLIVLNPNTVYHYVVNSTDQSSNSNESAEYSFTTAASSDTTPPAGVSDLNEIDRGVAWIQWSWTNPSDPDFNHTEICLDGIFQTITSAELFNATNLAPGTEYTIGTRTVDAAGNINQTWMNDTATTLPAAGTTIQLTIALNSGWNLISVPLNLTTWRLGNESAVGDPLNVTLENSLTSIYRYNTTSESFEKCTHYAGWGWAPATGSESFTELEPGRGYWVWAENDCDLTFTGTAPSDLSLPLDADWNCIGWYSTSEAELGEGSVVGDSLNITPENSLSSIYRYNTTSGSFEKCTHYANWGWAPATGSESFTELEPGRGYWAMAENDCVWNHET